MSKVIRINVRKPRNSNSNNNNNADVEQITEAMDAMAIDTAQLIKPKTIRKPRKPKEIATTQDTSDKPAKTTKTTKTAKAAKTAKVAKPKATKASKQENEPKATNEPNKPNNDLRCDAVLDGAGVNVQRHLASLCPPRPPPQIADFRDILGSYKGIVSKRLRELIEIRKDLEANDYDFPMTLADMRDAGATSSSPAIKCYICDKAIDTNDRDDFDTFCQWCRCPICYRCATSTAPQRIFASCDGDICEFCYLTRANECNKCKCALNYEEGGCNWCFPT